jgi:hypothetical protein
MPPKRGIQVRFLSGRPDLTEGDGTSVKTPLETPVETLVKTRAKTPEKILEALGARPDLTLAELAISIGKSVSAVERASAKLVKEGRLKYMARKRVATGRC